MPSKVILGFLLPFALAAALHAGDDWPQFRGPTQQGHSDSVGLPTEWSETQNIKFKTEIPGEGWSSPVVLGDQVWITAATEAGRSLRAICVNRDTGAILHNLEVFHVEPEKKNAFNSYASPTPILEKGRVYVCFGTYGSACLDSATGQPIWKNNELKLDHKEGPGSSPILYKNLYILHCDGMDVQYVAALDKLTGKLAWKVNRSYPFGAKPADRRKAYCVPLVANVEGKDQLLSIGASRISGLDPDTGAEIWWCDIPGYSNVPRPIYADGIAYICTGFDQGELWALKIAGATGDITKTNVLWRKKGSLSQALASPGQRPHLHGLRQRHRPLPQRQNRRRNLPGPSRQRLQHLAHFRRRPDLSLQRQRRRHGHPPRR